MVYFLKKYLLLICFGVLWPFATNAEKLIGVIFSQNVAEQNVIAVSKESKDFFLVKIVDDMPEVVQHIEKIKLGENGGDKEKKGDKKTPSGIYYVQSFIPDDKLPEIYGFGAFPLNYPNIVDRIYNKTGYGIWIHGIGNDPKLNTEGCIALDNKYIKTFKSKNITGLPVIITENVPFYKRGEYEQYKWGLINYLKQYHDLWQLNDYNNFKNFYHQEFRAGGSQTLKNYLSQKSKLMKLYPYKRILYDNVKIYRENDSEVLFDYNQLYCADNILSEGAKKLYLIREDNSFKIIAEEFTNSKEYSLTKAYILKYIRAWRNAWQNKNIDEYMKFYHKDFTGDGFNYNRWYDDKKDKFAKLRFIKVDISGITVKFIKPTLYRITFIQKFESDKYSDSGIKTIMLSGCISDNKIISEIWRPLKR